MAVAQDDLMLAVGLVLKMVSQKETPTKEDIDRNSKLVLDMLRSTGQAADVDLEQLVRDVEARCNVYVPFGTSLVDPRGHIEWLAANRAEIDWRFWERYRRWLEDYKELGPWAIRRLDETTGEVLKNLENPSRPGSWDRRGMVVGQVQSGKTANYIGLMCKAADAGYRLIVILAGTHNSLRAQTQLRIDEGFLGFDTQRRMLDGRQEKMGVGAMPGAPLYTAHTLTNSSDDGDFKLTVAKQAHVMVGGNDPVVLVIKKNASILANLIKWATFLKEQQDPATGRSMVKNVPLLVIDDEADSASVNTGKAAESDRPNDRAVTRINGLIRQLLNSFDQSAYVGYTATPFANILMFKGLQNPEFGEDLFPRSFILRLQAPSNHFGPIRVFGCRADPIAGIDAADGLPIVRVIDDFGGWVPNRHKTTWSCGPPPESLQRALRSFILVCAARAARGQEKQHNSMLIHVTAWNAVQSQIREQVDAELEYLRRRLKHGDGDSPSQLRSELRELWESDFVPTSESMEEYREHIPSWAEIDRLLYPAAAKIELRKINGTAKDALEYIEHPDGLSVIAIGGNKLSRGLTLEGLSVSYYLRASRMYDTLMQMGRWFGYRPGYEDLCRLYTTQELCDWYRDITSANEELLRLFDEMYLAGATPERFGLRIKVHPDGLLVTARAKMQDGEVMKVSLAGSIVETLSFDLQSNVLDANLVAAERLVRDMGEPLDAHKAKRTVIWKRVSPEGVLRYLEAYQQTGPRSGKSDPKVATRYINTRNVDGELTDWTVALISVADGRLDDVAGYQLGLVQRKADNENPVQEKRYSVGRLVNPTDETLDLSKHEIEQAIAETVARWRKNPGKSKRADDNPPTVAAGPVIRDIRPGTRGLLLIYPLDPKGVEPNKKGDPKLDLGNTVIIAHAISFPDSQRAGGVDYIVNNVYAQQEQLDFGDDLEPS